MTIPDLSRIFEPRPDPIPAPFIRTVQLVMGGSETDQHYDDLSMILGRYLSYHFDLTAVRPDYLLHATEIFPTRPYANLHPRWPDNDGPRSFPTAQATLVLRSGFEMFLTMARRAALKNEADGYHPVILYEPNAMQRDAIRAIFLHISENDGYPDSLKRRLRDVEITAHPELVVARLNGINRNARFGANYVI